jgi:hypothetical protein
LSNLSDGAKCNTGGKGPLHQKFGLLASAFEKSNEYKDIFSKLLRYTTEKLCLFFSPHEKENRLA